MGEEETGESPTVARREKGEDMETWVDKYKTGHGGDRGHDS